MAKWRRKSKPVPLTRFAIVAFIILAIAFVGLVFQSRSNAKSRALQWQGRQVQELIDKRGVPDKRWPNSLGGTTYYYFRESVTSSGDHGGNYGIWVETDADNRIVRIY